MGIGRIVSKNNQILEGMFNTNLDGFGRVVFDDGNYYIGEFKKGVKNGHGKFQLAQFIVGPSSYSVERIIGQGEVTLGVILLG